MGFIDFCINTKLHFQLHLLSAFGKLCIYLKIWLECTLINKFFFAAKIRRLYDIANILTSLELIRKVHVTEIRGRKPAFKYIGPDIDNIGEMSGKY